MPSVDTNGVTLAYEEAGAGAPIIFCHEHQNGAGSWERQLSYFSRWGRAIAYNQRGYPPSSVPADPDAYSEERSVADLRGLCDALGIDRAFLVGDSMGGGVALKFALAFPERCLGLVIAGAGAVATEEASHAYLDALDRGDMDQVVALVSVGGTRRQLRAKDPRTFDRFLGSLRALSPVGLAHTFRRVVVRRRAIISMEEELRSLSIPVLAMVGDEHTGCMDAALTMKRAIANSGLVVLAKTGHSCNLEEPELFNRTVHDFLTRVQLGRWT